MCANRARLTFVNDRSEFRTNDRFGISLHCHTQHSKEVLDFVPYYAGQFPVVSWLYEKQCKSFERANGRRPNFNLGYWEPPLTGRQLFDSESEAVEDLGLGSIVSITDHDSIRANLEVNEFVDNERAPISMEWTVPFGRAYFHVGVHNLPPPHAEWLSKVLLAYTASPSEEVLHDTLTLLNQLPGLLVILNHPFWDIEMIGQAAHDAALAAFVDEFRSYIHALELNGFRPWAENQLTMRLADELDMPLISGGDRHCLAPNTMINTSRAETFAEFVEEVRCDKRSNIVILPEYDRSLLYRQIRSISQVLGHYPKFTSDRQHWAQRVFFDAEDGSGATPLANRWSGRTPAFYRLAVGAMTCMGHPALSRVFELITKKDSPFEHPVAESPTDLATNEWYSRLRSFVQRRRRLVEE